MVAHDAAHGAGHGRGPRVALARLFPQPTLAIAMSALAAMGLWVAMAQPGGAPAMAGGAGVIGLAIGLVMAAIAADVRPIHLTYHTKVALTTTPHFLMAVLLPLPLAAFAAGTSTLVGELLERRRRGSLVVDIVTSAARAVVVVLGATGAKQLADFAGAPPLVGLFATATIMFMFELVTGGIEIAAVLGEPPVRVIRMLAREITPVESVQYLLGLLGASAATMHVGLLLLLLAPVVFVYRAFRSARELQKGTRQFLESLADTVDLRDPYTGGHSRRVTDYCGDILEELGLEGPDVELILTAARVHDIGKIGIPDGILNKPGALEPEERAIMETHPGRGAELLGRYPDFARGTAIVRHHHERWDGKGYPDRLAGYDIPFGARVIAVADAFDAMTSDRPYRRGMSRERALQILREGSGTQWDAQIIAAFLQAEAPAHIEAAERGPVQEQREQAAALLAG